MNICCKIYLKSSITTYFYVFSYNTILKDRQIKENKGKFPEIKVLNFVFILVQSLKQPF